MLYTACITDRQPFVVSPIHCYSNLHDKNGDFREEFVMFQFRDIVQIHFGFGRITLNQTRHKLAYNFVRAHMGVRVCVFYINLIENKA